MDDAERVAVGMSCECGGRTEVIDTRSAQQHVKRRRECTECGKRFSTHEMRVDKRPQTDLEIVSAQIEELRKLIAKRSPQRKKQPRQPTSRGGWPTIDLSPTQAERDEAKRRAHLAKTGQ